MFNVSTSYYYHTYSKPTHLTTHDVGVFGDSSHECGHDIDIIRFQYQYHFHNA